MNFRIHTEQEWTDNSDAAFSGDIRNSNCWDSKMFATAFYQVTGKTNFKTPKYRWIDTVNIIKCGHIVSSVLYFVPYMLLMMVVGLVCLRIMHPLEDGVVGIHSIGQLEIRNILLRTENLCDWNSWGTQCKMFLRITLFLILKCSITWSIEDYYISSAQCIFCAVSPWSKVMFYATILQHIGYVMVNFALHLK